MSNRFAALSWLAFAAVNAVSGGMTLAQPCSDFVDGAEIVLRDSIGPDTTWTDGNLGCASNVNTGTGGSWNVSPVVLIGAEPVHLKSFSWVGYPRPNTAPLPGGTFSFEAWSYQLRIWSSATAVGTSPQLGDVANVSFSAPSSGPLLFGVGPSNDLPNGPTNTYLMDFNIQSADLVLEPGEDYVIGVQVYTNPALSGFFKVSNSDWNEPVDKWHNQNFPLGTPATNCWAGSNGKHAIRITAMSLILRGDLTGNGDVWTDDITGFVEALLDPAAWPANHPEIPLLAANMNCDDVVDGGDVQGFVEKLLQP